MFNTYRDSFVSVDDGNIVFQVSEDDLDHQEVHSLLDIREIKLSSPGSNYFTIKLADKPPEISTDTPSPKQSSGASSAPRESEAKDACCKYQMVTLRASSNKEALEWIATIKHELKNQILVCKSMYSTLQAEGHHERAEPLFVHILELYKVVYDGRDHFDIAEALRSYGQWLSEQGRQEEAAQKRLQAKDIKRRCEEGLDSLPPLRGKT